MSKGYYSASVELVYGRNAQGQEIQADGAKSFLVGRFVGLTEAVWRSLNYQCFFSNTLTSDFIYIYFQDGKERQASENVSK